MKSSVIILDFGAQYSQLIAKKVRKLGYYSLVLPHTFSLSELQEYKPAALIFSGGPFSIYEKNAPLCDEKIFVAGIPILGICYGMQLLSHFFGGKVVSSRSKEYGEAFLTTVAEKNPLFHGLGYSSSPSKQLKVWMSHGDQVSRDSLPPGFKVLALSEETTAAIADVERKIYGVQFHPEVVHTDSGEKFFSNFLKKITGLEPNWDMPAFIKREIEQIRKTVGNKKVILALSGGVDSSVLAVLLHEAIGDQLFCIFIDNGLLRLGEARQVVKTFRDSFDIPFKYINAKRNFLNYLRWIKDPEKKRKIIGKMFIKILKKESKGFYFLAQGTLYPDVIESVSCHGPSDTIKTHHNRVNQVLKLKKAGRLIEPFAELFKDEVREIGKELGVPDEIVYRQPFPGPGLAVRILGRVTQKRLLLLKRSDYIFQRELKTHPDYPKLWQAFAVLLPIRSVGVVGDQRSYGYTIVLRAVSGCDGMTADFEILDKKFLIRISNKIIGEVRGITRVVWDITSKPPATIEWE